MSVNLGNFVSRVEGEYDIRVYDKEGTLKYSLPRNKNIITEYGKLLLIYTNDASYQDKKFIDPRYYHQNPNNSYSRNPNKQYWYNNKQNLQTWIGNLFFGNGTGVPKETDRILFSTIGYGPLRTIDVPLTVELPNEEHPKHFKQTYKYTYVFTPYCNDYDLTELGIGYRSDSVAYPELDGSQLKAFEWKYTDPDQDPFFDNYQENNAYYESRYIYTLATHSMIKDEDGNNTSIHVLKGDYVECDYYFNIYYSAEPYDYEFTVTYKTIDGKIRNEVFEAKSLITFVKSGNIVYAIPPSIPGPHTVRSHTFQKYLRLISEEALNGHDFTTTDLNDLIDGLPGTIKSIDDVLKHISNNVTNIVNPKVAEDQRVALRYYNVWNEYNENGIINFGIGNPTYSGYYPYDVNWVRKEWMNDWRYSSYNETKARYFTTDLPVGHYFYNYRHQFPTPNNNFHASSSNIFHPYSYNPKGFTVDARIRGFINILGSSNISSSTDYYKTNEIHILTLVKNKTTGRGIEKRRTDSIVIQMNADYNNDFNAPLPS